MRETAAIGTETARLKRLAGGVNPPFAECFMTEPSPGIIATTMLNAYYPSHEAYLDAIAREIGHEYRAVVDAGFVLQIDAPNLAMERVLLYQDKSDAEFVEIIEQHIAALNKALAGIPRDRIRLHVCWGNWEGPHVHDVALDLLLPVLYQAEVGGLSIEFANPRRQHEIAALRRHRFPDDMVLLPGVIDPKSNFVEHPEVVARRIESAVGAIDDRERVIASCDCGFGTFQGGNGLPRTWCGRSCKPAARAPTSRLPVCGAGRRLDPISETMSAGKPSAPRTKPISDNEVRALPVPRAVSRGSDSAPRQYRITGHDNLADGHRRRPVGRRAARNR
jgi:5-methyltetrahydropteroyltriglutamate--homocysteine methyltransferase